MARYLCLISFFVALAAIASAQNYSSALLKYSLADLEGTSTLKSPAPSTSAAEKSGADGLIQQLLGKAGKKEQKIIKQILEIGQERKILNLEKIERKLGKINVAGLVNLYQNLKALKSKKFDLNRLDDIKATLSSLDSALKQVKDSPREFGDLSFFAGLTRDQLANVAASPIEKQSLRASALGNYNDTLKNLAAADDRASQEKVADAKERIVSLETPFGNLVPIAPKKGAGKVFITSDYGMRIHPVKKTRRFHSGVDLAGWKCKGWKVFSIGPGRVVKSGWETGYGYVVIVSHEIEGKQYFSRYAHLLKKDRLKNGTLVKHKDVVGYCNNSGISTGSHLHFEVREGSYSGKTMDPKDYLPEIQILK